MKEYTPIRKFYAWVGFAVIIAGLIYLGFDAYKTITACEPNMSTERGPAYADPETGRITICG